MFIIGDMLDLGFEFSIFFIIDKHAERQLTNMQNATTFERVGRPCLHVFLSVFS